MRIKSQDVIVKLPGDAGEPDAVFTFKKHMKLNDDLLMAERSAALPDGAEKTRLLYDYSIRKLIRVENLFDEQGQPITLQQIKALDVYQGVIVEIITAYNLAVAGDSAEKKDSKPE